MIDRSDEIMKCLDCGFTASAHEFDIGMPLYTEDPIECPKCGSDEVRDKMENKP